MEQPVPQPASSLAAENESRTIFTSADTKTLLKNKKIVFVGDSNYRGMYRDFVLLLQEDRLLTTEELRIKCEESMNNDALVFRTAATNGSDFHEIREYQSADGFYLVQFYFVTKCYYDAVEAMLLEFEKEMPDVIIMNSCQWDVTRYGGRGPDNYLRNMNILLSRLHSMLKPTTIFLWCTALPLASKIVAGFLLAEIKFCEQGLRYLFTLYIYSLVLSIFVLGDVFGRFILQANYEVAQLVTSYGFDVLDLHYYMRSQHSHRVEDGVHWDAWAHRHISQLLLTFLCDTWGLPLPENTVNLLREAEQNMDKDVNLPHLAIDGVPVFLNDKVFEHRMQEQLLDNEGDNAFPPLPPPNEWDNAFTPLPPPYEAN